MLEGGKKLQPATQRGFIAIPKVNLEVRSKMKCGDNSRLSAGSRG